MIYIAAVPCGIDRAEQHAAAWKLLSDMLSALQISVASDAIKHSAEGKPYIDGKSIHFSLSHTAGAAVCAISVGARIGKKLPENIWLECIDAPVCEVGVDIEGIEKRDFEKIARGFFTADENEYLSRSENTAEAFYYIYTRKESLAKKDGRGITKLRSMPSVLQNDKLYTYNIAIADNPYIMSIAI